MEISTMTLDDLKIAISWAKREGWNPGLHDAECFFKADPNGFFKGTIDNKIIAVGSAVAYGDEYGFCGLYIVDKDYRGKNFGFELTKARLNYLGDRLTGIDGVLEMTDKYSKIGYVKQHENIRFKYSSNFEFINNINIVDLSSVDFAKLSNYDRKYFPAKRDNFLKSWISQHDSFALSYIQNNSLQGYGVIRKCIAGHKIGPLFAENQEIANHIFQALVNKAASNEIYIDMPEPNPAVKQFIKDYSLKEVFYTTRMYRNGMPNINLNNIFGITTFELG